MSKKPDALEDCLQDLEQASAELGKAVFREVTSRFPSDDGEKRAQEITKALGCMCDVLGKQFSFTGKTTGVLIDPVLDFSKALSTHAAKKLFDQYPESFNGVYQGPTADEVAEKREALIAVIDCNFVFTGGVGPSV